MAHSSSTLRFVCRSCQKSISRSSFRVRAFSSGASRAKTIPAFEPTSSPELDDLFLDWRQRVFKPAALNPTHKSLVYKKSRHVLIENDPGVTVTMSDGEDVKLEPMNAYDKPNKRQALRTIAKVLGETSEVGEWLQLPAFLEGLKLADEKVPDWWLEKMARKANEQGRSRVVKQCAQMVKRTGLSLSNPLVTRELFLGYHERAVDTKFQGEEFESEYKSAHGLALMLEADDHCGGSVNAAKGQVDMRKDLTVAGVLLELAAGKANSVHGGKDIEGEVGNSAQKLIALSQSGILATAEGMVPSRAVEAWLPIANGIRLALQVKDLAVGKGRNAEADLKAALKERLGQLEAAISEAINKVKAEANGKQRRAVVMFEKVQQAS